MIKKLLLIGCFLSLFTSLNAQTLSAGDIAIIGVNFDTSPNYEITIVTLAPIVANTQIRISDYWYNESTPNTLTNVSAASGIALKAEGGILWQPTAAITPGTVFKIEITKGANTVTGLPGNVTVTGWTDPSPTASPGNPGGENWFIYQGSSITNVSNFIFLWGNGFPFNINSINITAGKFVTTGIGDLSLTTVTYLPPSLTLGTNAIALTTVTYHGDNNVYTGIREGTKESILAKICNLDKWNYNETIPYNIDPGGTNFPGLNPIFTITTPPNTAPTDVALSATTINENVTGNSTIGSLTSTDANTGDTFTYTLVAGTGDTDNASFNINDSDLRITASPDFETKSSYSVRIRTTDQGGLTFEKVFTITVNNVNEAPTDVALSANTINENVSANSAVGTLSSTDADASNTFTYTLVAGTGDTDNTAFTITGNSMTINASPDFETKSSYSVRIRTTDQGGLTFEKAFTITINNVNEAPTDIALSNTSINENVSANSALGALSSTDPDSGNTFTYNLVAGAGSTDNASFSITGNSLTINASPDFETKSSYSVRIRTTDQGSLTFEKVFTITVNNLCDIVLTSASQTNIACNGGSTGAATVNAATGGTGPYTYNWTPGTPTGDGTTSVTGLTAGTWTCTVTDANGCNTTQNFTVTQTAAISTATAAQTNVSCNGGSNGSASVTPSGGAGGYTYSWSPSGGTAATATGLSAGTYTVTVTDANACTATRNFTITQPTTISTATAAQTNVSCNGGSNGSASVTPSGGAGGYTYSWSPSGGTAATATGLAAGTYTVTVTDANACTATRNFTITQPTTISTATAAQTNVSCNGGSNGSASVTPSGGAGGYTYSWSPSGGTAATATGLSAGTYTVTVTDANACTVTRNFTITQPMTISTATAAQTNVSCNGGSNGSASVTPSGGAGGYTYSWSPSGGTAATATGLSAGTYTVTVTDANACTVTRNFTITQPTAISTATAAQTNVSCNGDSNGSASVTPSGGAGGYTYSWSPSGGTAATATGLAAGTYTVTVTDANSCTATQNFTITEPMPIDFTTTILSGYDYNTGYSETIVTSRGTGTKTYAVTAGSLPSGFSLSSAGQITGISTQIADSNFTVTATDANNCIATYNYVLKLNQIPITVTATPSQTKVYGESDPVLTYTVSPSLLPGDSFTGALARVSGEDIGNYAINQGSLSAGSKYLITFVGTNFTITAKPITVTATPSQTKVYGATDPIFDYTVSPSLVGSDAITGALTRVAGENIGTYTINQGSLSAGSNYTISYADANFTITAKPITVTATPSQTKVYGTTDPAFTYTVSPNLVGSDAFTGALTRVAGENIGNYAITQGNLSAGSNYTISYISKDFAITAKPIIVTADPSQTKEYGTANPVYSYTVSPSLVSGDSFTGTLTRTSGENIGIYAITQGSLSAGSNYTITYVSKDFTITAKPITVTAAASQTKVYGTTDPVFAYTVSPSLVSGDSFTGTLTRAAGENVGVYAITQGSLSAGGNYTITYNGSNFTITKADQVITWNQTLGLGCNGETSLVMTAVANSGLAVNYTSSNATIASVSNNSLLFQNYGDATITASQPGNMNYNAAPTVVLPVVSSQPNLIRKQFENIIFFDNSSKSFKSYTWYKNGVLVPSQTSQYFKENSALNGTYYAVATKLDGTLITTCPLTLSPSVEEEYIRIVPNPVRSNANFQLITNVSSTKLQNARVELYNLTGSLLTTITNPSQNTIDMIAPSAGGIYIVKMTLANGKYFTKNLLVKN
ncbi:Por secretion system C-terminal sorting domain-containing protein [Flavobacterium succinicans]|uniref:Por secretion system C-terminal sorting domain-containing protein n=2 Tax=Flavobacterium succinicans TaxID=29536 RepID=A0A1I4SKA6_9FLAO|nr:MBG domain-containing protein [Flavobacterium succinicans]SFM64869.1 Por secretion system C-terminal sorting domain-containing protein [Flavobacterium succinicans]